MENKMQNISFEIKTETKGDWNVCPKDNFDNKEEWVKDVFSALIMEYGGSDTDITELSFTDLETGEVYHYENN